MIFNNMLNVIIGYAGLVIDELKPDDPILDSLHEIADTSRSKDLTELLLTFARKQTYCHV